MVSQTWDIILILLGCIRQYIRDDTRRIDIQGVPVLKVHVYIFELKKK